MIRRGVLGYYDGAYKVNFTKPGVDYDDADPADMVFRTDVEEIRPLVSGMVTLANNANVDVTMPKTFVLCPLVFAAAKITSTTMTGYDDRLTLTLTEGSNKFNLKNKLGATADIYYKVFDNEIGQRLFSPKGHYAGGRYFSGTCIRMEE